MRVLTHGSLFAGIGGFDLGFERAGIKTVWQVEIDPFCRRVLERHFPGARRFSDIRECGRDNLAAVDVVTGGFPCQDVSHAGRRVGIDGSRSGLWREMRRIIRELRPSFTIVENTSGLLDRGMERVLGEMAADGFDAEWTMLSACSFGAPHPRNRVFILAYPSGQRPGQLRRIECAKEGETSGDLHWAEYEPPCERVVNGIPERLERLTALGNAVVPQISEWIGRRIVEVNALGEWGV
ncbi:MAG: DNA-cytosine methyltransferase [Candidatus Sulfotelmatobacter sp.]|nr:DNA-cytosine methyltransferase [Candidatus Sulfotelmatobacter sp.]